MHGWCNTKPTGIFPVAERHCPLTGFKSYCLDAEVYECERPAQNLYHELEQMEAKPAISWFHSDVLTVKCCHVAMCCGSYKSFHLYFNWFVMCRWIERTVQQAVCTSLHTELPLTGWELSSHQQPASLTSTAILLDQCMNLSWSFGTEFSSECHSSWSWAVNVFEYIFSTGSVGLTTWESPTTWEQQSSWSETVSTEYWDG